jgi:DHA1 family bicyclomycin/chloramphenicol resistance-like MFS transporter
MSEIAIPAEALPAARAAPVRFGLLAMGALAALAPVSTDIGLPGLPTLGRALGVSVDLTGLTLSVFMLGFALTPLVYGRLSDRHGRRPLVLAGLAIYLLGGLGCTVAPDLPTMLVARFIQGMGAGCGPTLAFAATRDRVHGPALAHQLAALTALLNLAPVIAPTIGTALLMIAGWRSCYALMAGSGGVLLLLSLLRFDETRPAAALGVEQASLRADLARLFSHRAAITHICIFATAFGSVFAYIATSSLLLTQRLGASPVLYAGLFALTAGGIVAGARLAGPAAAFLGVRRLLTVALLTMLAAAGGGVAALTLLPPVLLAIMPCMIVSAFAYGLVAPNAVHGALDPVPQIAGVASAVMNTLQVVCAALSSLAATLLFAPLGATAVPATMAGFAILALLCHALGAG